MITINEAKKRINEAIKNDDAFTENVIRIVLREVSDAHGYDASLDLSRDYIKVLQSPDVSKGQNDE